MTGNARKTIRCAIYTRVSTDQGLEQDFNSLDAQYDASQAYIRSQAHAGWTLVRTKYDDGGFSGGNTDRPALQRLLNDVKGNKIDIIVVYKVDRLTRSLADFAKLVELFDQHGVSFVSVTQQFNTTTSMGRLTLNVLLSFAQFEREVTSERIRDKIAASKRKGLWVGGMVPLGYDTRDRKITVNKTEAATVRMIFESYLRLGSFNLLLADLRQRGIVTRKRVLKSGKTVGGIPFGRGGLGHLLRNRFYIGEVVYKGEVFPGEQPAIIERKLFDAVQARLDAKAPSRRPHPRTTQALLAGRLYDDHGQRMTPTYTRKAGKTYRYYISGVLNQGEPQKAGRISRVSAGEIEDAVAMAVRDHLNMPDELDAGTLIETSVARVDLRPDRLIVELSRKALKKSGRDIRLAKQLEIPWKKVVQTRRREILLPEGTEDAPPRPIRSETRALLVASVARGRRWLDELITDPALTVERIAARERCSPRKVNMTISLAFLAPGLVKAAIDGRLPDGLGVTRLCDLPSDWNHQYRMLGLPMPDVSAISNRVSR
jgi:DNA invertase Pin-like site-specific DNA recombinase